MKYAIIECREVYCPDDRPIKKYYLDENGEGGSTIQAVENFIHDHFKVISPYTSYTIEW